MGILIILCGLVIHVICLRNRSPKKLCTYVLAYSAIGVVFLFHELILVETKSVLYEIYSVQNLANIIDNSDEWRPLVGNEIISRVRNKSLSEDDIEVMLTVLLDKVRHDQDGYRFIYEKPLAELHKTGILTAEQKIRFYKQLVLPILRVRKIVVSGDPVPCQVICHSLLGEEVWPKLDVERIVVDDCQIRYEPRKQIPGLTTEGFNYPNRIQLLQYKHPGHHALEIRGTLKYYPFPRGNCGNLLYERDISVKKNFTIVEGERNQYVSVVTDDYLNTRGTHTLKPDRIIWFNYGRRGIFFMLSPFLFDDCAFDITIKANGEIYSPGSHTDHKTSPECSLYFLAECPKSRNSGYHLSKRCINRLPNN